MFKQFSYSEKTKSYNDKKKLIINYLASHQYGQLESLIKQFSKIDAENFFQKCGYGILSYVIINSSDINALDCVVNIARRGLVSEQSIQEILRYQEFDILKNYLIGRYTKESYTGEYTQDKRDLMIEKFKILFEIDPEGICDFIKNNEYEYYMSDSIKEDFKKATESIRATQVF